MALPLEWGCTAGRLSRTTESHAGDARRDLKGEGRERRGGQEREPQH